MNTLYNELVKVLERDSEPKLKLDDSLRDKKLSNSPSSSDVIRTTPLTDIQLSNQCIDSQVLKNDPNDIYNVPPIDSKLLEDKPWKRDAKYFSKCKISSLALMKMSIHAQQGGSIEIMGMLIGKIIDNTIVVLDTYRLPVEGTETRVNAQGEAYEYMVQYLELNQRISSEIETTIGEQVADESNAGKSLRREHIVGWYHSHPGYGCWLSGIDVSTQELNQNFQDPYLAIVVDPIKTLKSGKVDIGAFRTLPSGYQEQSQPQSKTSTSSATKSKAKFNLPKSKRQEFGSHSNRYYSLDVEIFENSNDSEMLNLINNQKLQNQNLLTNYGIDLNDKFNALQEEDFKNINFLKNFEILDENNNSNENLKKLIKDLDSLKSPIIEKSTNNILKKLVNFHKENKSKLNDEVTGKIKATKGKSKKTQEIVYDDEDVLDESDLEKNETGRDDRSAGMTDEEEDELEYENDHSKNKINVSNDDENDDSKSSLDKNEQRNLDEQDDGDLDDMETDEEESQSSISKGFKNSGLEQRHNSRIQKGSEHSANIKTKSNTINSMNDKPRRLKRRQGSDQQLQSALFQQQQQHLSRRDQLDDTINFDNKSFMKQQQDEYIRRQKYFEYQRRQQINHQSHLSTNINNKNNKINDNNLKSSYNPHLQELYHPMLLSNNEILTNQTLLGYGMEFKNKNKNLIDLNNLILSNKLCDLISLDGQEILNFKDDENKENELSSNKKLVGNTDQQ
ncbi:RRI1 [Candida jiufengensis]|uniref:RRI1 n=1 Tax=Candida jiufengensis TaxID=497108 RepID=UPI00222488A7|nr:RRI1 [Candida jiufengensis]KAI5955243.1 RRI1 [Candida jiufengensis]